LSNCDSWIAHYFAVLYCILIYFFRLFVSLFTQKISLSTYFDGKAYKVDVQAYKTDGTVSKPMVLP